MWNKLTVKYKYYLFYLGSLLLLVGIYKNNVSKTIQYYLENKQMNNRLSTNNTSIEEQYISLLNRTKEIASLFGSSDSSKTQVKDELDLVSGLIQKHHIKLISFPESILVKKDDFEIKYDNFVVEGNFIQITTFLNALEGGNNLGRVRSVNYQSTANSFTKEKHLRATVYYQVIE